jgi:hypothetical protein
MAKDLPYFKFFCSEWNDGDITLEDYHLQGVFINVCSYYWSNECDLSKEKAYKKFRGLEEELDKLISLNLVKCKDDFFTINFLDEQWQERLSKSNKNRQIAIDAWNKRKESERNANASETHSESDTIKKREEKKREEKKRDIDFIYSLYPTVCPVQNRPITKGKKAKEKIKQLLKDISKEHLETTIRGYLINSDMSKSYIKDFTTFLNNLPDLNELREINIALQNKSTENGIPKNETFEEKHARLLKLAPKQ